ncbi:type I secretion C-terminal target domain-containing protein, partial [Azohydromonas lata]
DTFVLSPQQYATLLQGARDFATQQPTVDNGWDAGLVSVPAQATEITDFTAGANGDVLDVNELLRNAAVNFDGGNPFDGGYLLLVQQGADTLVQFDAEGLTGAFRELVTIAVLRNVDAAQMSSANFEPAFEPTVAEQPGINHAPVGDVNIEGDGLQGHTLSAVHALSDADGLGDLVYQWLRDGEAIAGANHADYRLTQEDVGKAISVQVSYVDLQG